MTTLKVLIILLPKSHDPPTTLSGQHSVGLFGNCHFFGGWMCAKLLQVNLGLGFRGLENLGVCRRLDGLWFRIRV